MIFKTTYLIEKKTRYTILFIDLKVNTSLQNLRNPLRLGSKLNLPCPDRQQTRHGKENELSSQYYDNYFLYEIGYLKSISQDEFLKYYKNATFPAR